MKKIALILFAFTLLNCGDDKKPEVNLIELNNLTEDGTIDPREEFKKEMEMDRKKEKKRNPFE